MTQINTRFPHWFARNYHRSNDTENLLPVEQHLLLALMAPRLVYVASARGDVAADMRAEFRSCVEAAPVFSSSNGKAWGTSFYRKLPRLVMRAQSGITCARESATCFPKTGAGSWTTRTGIFPSSAALVPKCRGAV
ncbi:MAG: hypothetical protein PSV13_07255 [Lacunisphaera sp.]|nr:hypothetical protein [Lacunisphaera sp.]